jgi:hypothetical protein
MPRFTIMVGRDLVETCNVVKDRVLIGRSSKSDIILDNLMISRHHAEVVRSGKTWVVNNLSGRNGVFVGGRWVDTHVLKHGDVVELGKYSIRFEWPREEREKLISLERKEAGAGFRVTTSEMLARIEEEERQQNVARASDGVRKGNLADSRAETVQLKPDELAKVRQAMATVKRAHLALTTSGGNRKFDIKASGTTVGKGGDCDVRIYTGWLAPKVSVVVSQASGGGFALDVKGGTVKINGDKVDGVRKLADKDTIDIEGTSLKFFDTMQG